VLLHNRFLNKYFFFQLALQYVLVVKERVPLSSTVTSATVKMLDFI